MRTMKVMPRWLVSCALVGVGLAGCSDPETTAPEGGPRVTIAVAPLELAGLSEVCYDLAVHNGPDGTGELVWSRGTPGLNGGTPDPGAICSTRYGSGAGGDFAYVGTCDASDQLDADPAGERMNSVTVWFDGLYSTAGSYLPPDGEQGWKNPCVDATGAVVGCTLDVLCEENADARVELNLTMMRQANQGFFDVAVTFEDIFCSAKFDCREADGDPMKLLHNAEGVRDTTMVLAFACTSGAGETTWLHMSDMTVECGLAPETTTYTLSPKPLVSLGNQGVVVPLFYQTAVYMGDEQLAPYDKCYWNMALGLSGDAPASCTLNVDASASTGAWAGGSSPANTVYPYVHYEIPITDAAGELACGRHALNDASARVTTRYTTAAGTTLRHARQCGTTIDEQLGVSCTGTVPGLGSTTAVFRTEEGATTVSFGASAGPTLGLPAGLTVGDCCVNPCCGP